MVDDDLRERFRALRREDLRAAPEYSNTVSRARSEGIGDAPSMRPWRWAPAAVVVAAMLWIALSRTEPSSAPESALWQPGHWAMPTDVLLELPGSALLRELPAIGVDGSTKDPAASLRFQFIGRNSA